MKGAEDVWLAHGECSCLLWCISTFCILHGPQDFLGGAEFLPFHGVDYEYKYGSSKKSRRC